MDVLLRLERIESTPLWRQIYVQLRDATLSGTLSAGERLPSSRALAATLGVSRNVVLEAYEQLVAEGYLESRPQSGMVVAAGLRPVPMLAPQEQEPPGVDAAPADLIDFRPGLPALEHVPRQEWGRLMQSVCREATPAQWGYGPPEGDEEARSALCRHLARTRGVRARPGQGSARRSRHRC